MCRGSPGNNYKIDRNVSPPQVTQVSRTEHAPQPGAAARQVENPILKARRACRMIYWEPDHRRPGRITVVQLSEPGHHQRLQLRRCREPDQRPGEREPVLQRCRAADLGQRRQRQRRRQPVLRRHRPGPGPLGWVGGRHHPRLAGQDGQPWVQSYTPAVSSSAAIYVLHDQQGTPLGMVRGGTSYAFVTDNIGSVTAIVDSSGSTDATYTYGPYGPVLSDNGSLAPANLLGYTGALTDISSGNATGYTHDGNRWYDTATGAFTTQDTSTYLANPANGNRYAYAADNPANYLDPTGQSSCSTLGWIATGLGIGALVLGVVASTVASGGTLGVAAVFGSIAFGEGSVAFGLASNFC